jgi:hypothetical protein
MFYTGSGEWQTVTRASELGCAKGVMIEYDLGYGLTGVALITTDVIMKESGTDDWYVQGVKAVNRGGAGGLVMLGDKLIRQAREVGLEGMRVRALPPEEAADVKLFGGVENPYAKKEG